MCDTKRIGNGCQLARVDQVDIRAERIEVKDRHKKEQANQEGADP